MNRILGRGAQLPDRDAPLIMALEVLLNENLERTGEIRSCLVRLD